MSLTETSAPPLWLDLLTERVRITTEGLSSVAYVRRHGIDVNTVMPVVGIPVLAPVRYLPDRSFDPGGRTPSVVIEVQGDNPNEVIDLVAWPLERPEKFARLHGRAAVLGIRAIHDPETYSLDRPLKVHRTPLAWLQSGCDGVVLLDPIRGGRILLDAPGRIAAQDDDHAAELVAALEASLRLDRIVVPVNRPA